MLAATAAANEQRVGPRGEQTRERESRCERRRRRAGSRATRIDGEAAATAAWRRPCPRRRPAAAPHSAGAGGHDRQAPSRRCRRGCPGRASGRAAWDARRPRRSGRRGSRHGRGCCRASRSRRRAPPTQAARVVRRAHSEGSAGPAAGRRERSAQPRDHRFGERGHRALRWSRRRGEASAPRHRRRRRSTGPGPNARGRRDRIGRAPAEVSAAPLASSDAAMPRPHTTRAASSGAKSCRKAANAGRGRIDVDADDRRLVLPGCAPPGPAAVPRRAD